MVFPVLIQPDDVGMLQPRQGTGLAGEARPQLRLDCRLAHNHFESDDAVQIDIAGLVHNPHAALPQFG